METLGTLFFEKYASFARSNEPAQVSIPFPKGNLSPNDVNRFIVWQNHEQNQEQAAKTQVKILSNWDDGSVKWLKVNFLADLPANHEAHYVYGLANLPIASQNMSVWEENNRTMIDNGCLQIVLNGKGQVPFHSFVHKYFYLQEHEIDGPYVEEQTGQKFVAMLDSGWEIEESGEVLLKLKANGKHVCNELHGLNFELLLYVYANTPWVELKYRIINKMPSESVVLGSMGLDFHFQNKKASACALATSNYHSDIQTSKGEPLSFMIDAKFLLNDANEQTPEVFYGTFFADWNNQQTGGVCATMYQAYQNFPKAFLVDESTLSIQLLPEAYKGLKLHRGMAKTHSFFLHFHDCDATMKEINQRSLMLQSMDLPTLNPSTYKKSGIYEHIFVEQTSQLIENALQAGIDARGKAYGILHWGDYPDPGYSEQGRGQGEPVWTNNEYDFPFAAMQMYVRKPTRRYFDYMLTAAYHWADVDICHYDENPLRMGAQIIHSAEHVSGYVEISHEWVEGLFAAYYATGERLFYESALGIGHNIMQHLDEPRYHQDGEINARETGWALRALVALYRETNDVFWLSKTKFIVSHFVSWKKRYGGWFSPYTDHTVIRVPFMIAIAVGSLMRYYRIKPETFIKQMIVDAVDDLVEHCLLENGQFYYKELPSLKRPGANTLLLEALANAYELTGNEHYLRVGMPTFLLYARSPKGGGGGTKKQIKDGVLALGNGPKVFAQSFFPIVLFYDCVSRTSLFSMISDYTNPD